MPEAIQFCDRCSGSIPRDDIAGGRAVVSAEVTLCASCARSLTSPQRSAIARDYGRAPTKAERGAPTSRSGRHRAARPSTRTSGRSGRMRSSRRPSSFPTATFGILGAVTVVGVLIGVLVLRGDLGAPAPKPTGKAQPTAPADGATGERPAEPTTPAAARLSSPKSDVQAPAPGDAEPKLQEGQPQEDRPQETQPQQLQPNPPAAKRLDEIRAMIDPSLGRYDDVVAALKAFPGEFPGAKEVADAGKLLADCEEKHAKLVEGEDEEASVPAGGPVGPSPDETGPPQAGEPSATPGEATPEDAPAVSQLPKGPKEPLPGETGMPGQWAPGLVAEIFDGNGLDKRAAVRIDPSVNFNFDDAPPDPLAGAGGFTVRWTGWLLIPVEGKYVFEVQGDDRFSVSLDGELLAESTYRGKTKSKARRYTAGLYPISATLYGSGGGDFALLRWKRLGGGRLEPWQRSRGGGLDPLGREFYFHKVPELGEKGPEASVCQGLQVEHYAGENFDLRLSEGTRRHVDFDVEERPFCGSRAVVFPRDHFSVRMKGYLLVPKTGKYRFEIDVDDGARLYVDGAKLCEHWGTVGKDKLTGEADLSAGFREFVLEYMDETAKARLKVKWDPPDRSDRFTDMPSNVFFHEPPEPTTVDRDRLAPGMAGSFFRGERPGIGKPLLETYDPSAYFDWEKRKPAGDVPKNGFSAAWNGYLVVPETGKYLFRVRHYGGFRLAIGRSPILSKWKATPGCQDAAISLRAGSVQFGLTYFNRAKRAGLEVYWAGPSFGFRRLGPEALAHKADELPMGKVLPEPAEPAAVAAVKARGGAAPKGAAPKGPGAAARRGRSGPPGARTARPAPEKPATEKPPEGNVVSNGGFEEKNDRARFASFWKPHQWGEQRVQYWARISRSEPHAGEAALVVKAFGEGARSGAYTTLTLPAGKYEVSYWACADVDETARVGGELAGRKWVEGLAEKAVGDKWKQFRETVDVPEKQVGASLRLWTTTKTVRVWFDDVEVRYKGPSEAARPDD